ELAVPIRVPADVIDVQVRQEDNVDAVRSNAGLGERGQQSLLPLRRPAPQTRRADAGVDEDGRAAGAQQVRRAADAPLRAIERVRIERPVRLPTGEARVEHVPFPEQPDGVDERDELDRADYQRAPL